MPDRSRLRIDSKQAAEMIGVTPTTIRTWAAAGRFPSVPGGKYGRNQIRPTIADVEAEAERWRTKLAARAEVQAKRDAARTLKQARADARVEAMLTSSDKVDADLAEIRVLLEDFKRQFTDLPGAVQRIESLILATHDQAITKPPNGGGEPLQRRLIVPLPTTPPRVS